MAESSLQSLTRLRSKFRIGVENNAIHCWAMCSRENYRNTKRTKNRVTHACSHCPHVYSATVRHVLLSCTKHRWDFVCAPATCDCYTIMQTATRMRKCDKSSKFIEILCVCVC